MELTTKTTITPLKAIKRLAEVCDGAQQQDKVGFNKPDAEFFKDFFFVSVLTENQQTEFKERLNKYKNQLDVDEIVINIPNQSEEAILDIQKKEKTKAIKKSVNFKNGKALIRFDYDKNLVNDIKFINGRRFDYQTKTWEIEITKSNVKDVEDYLDYFTFDYDKGILKSLGEQNNNKIFNRDNLTVIKFDFDSEVLREIKRISGRKFDFDTKEWRVTLNHLNISQYLNLIKKFPIFEISDEVKEKVGNLILENEKKETLQKENLKASKALSSDFNVKGFKGVLRPFQKAGVQYIIKNKKVIVGDEMGLGKTIETIASIEHLNSYPALISCPNSLKYNWKREYEKFVDRHVEIINSNTDIENLDKTADVYILNYNSLSKFYEKLIQFNFKAVVSDESHFLKNSKAQRTKAFKYVVDNSKTDLVLLLTGTLIVNRPNELLSPLTILDKLNIEFGGFWNFATRYCSAHRTRFGLDLSGSSNLDELHEKLRSLCYIRRNKSEVLKELPPKTRQVIELDISNRSKYNKAKNDLIEYLKNEIEVNADFLDSIKDLSIEEQLKSKKEWRNNKANKAKSAEHLVSLNELKKLTAEGKLKEVKDWIRNVIESGEKLVVFAIHRNMVKELSEEFNCNRIDGSVSSEDRDKYVQDFQNNPKTKLIVLNIQAGSVGLTLTAAQKLAFVELGWTPGEHDQAEDRIHRIGQENNVNIYYLLGQGTIDSDIYELIEEKRKVTNAVNKGETISKDINIMNELLNKLTNEN